MRERVVLIVSNGQVGTGSFIAPGHILTCAHVVRKSVVENTNIDILYYVNENNKWQSRELNISSNDILLSPLVLQSEHNDIAIIKIDLQNHLNILLPRESDGVYYNSDQEYVAFGFQKKDINTGKNIPQTVSLQYEGEEGGSNDLKIIFEDGMIRPGMSGAPLLERETGMITGMVQKTRNPNDNLGAYTIPVERIWLQIKSWQAEGKSNLYQLLISKKYRRSVRKKYEESYSQIQNLKENIFPIVFLAAVLFGGIYWIFRHYGTIDKAGWLAALIAALPLLGNYLGNLYSKDHLFFKKTIGKIVLKPFSLMLLGGLVLYFWTFKSSVWIYGSRDHAQTPIVLIDKGKVEKSITKQLDRNGETRFLVNTSIFGQEYVISSNIYEPKTIKIRAFEKKELFLPDSFILEPVVLLRINTDFFSDLENYYCVVFVGSNDSTKIDNLSKERGSILLGNRRIEIEPRLKTVWRQSLVSSGFSQEIIELFIDGWADYYYINSNLSYNQKVDLKFYHKESNALVFIKQYEINKTEEDIYVSF
jgi:hypothetical protein